MISKKEASPSGDIPSIVVLILLFQNLAFGRQLPWSLLPFKLGWCLWLLAASAFVGAIVFRPAAILGPVARAFDRLLDTRAFFVALAAGNLAFSLYAWFKFRAFGYAFPSLHVAICLAGAFLLRRDRLGVSFAFSLALLGASIWHFPIADARSDMLAVIRRGFEQLASGVSPYEPMTLSWGASIMPYLPGTFFAHAPAWLLGLDLRFDQLLYRAAWMGLAWKARPRRRSSDLLHAFVLSPFFNFRHDLYFEVFFLLFAVYALKPRLRAAALPLLVLTRQWAWVLSPFLLLDGLKGSRRKVATLAGLGAATLAACGAFFLLLRASTTLERFLASVFTFQKIAHAGGYAGDYGLTFAPVFFWIGGASWLQPIQLLVWALVLWRAFRARSSAERRYLAFVALAVFVMLNMHFWLYFWLTPAFYLITLQLDLEAQGCYARATAPAG